MLSQTTNTKKKNNNNSINSVGSQTGVVHTPLVSQLGIMTPSFLSDHSPVTKCVCLGCKITASTIFHDSEELVVRREHGKVNNGRSQSTAGQTACV